MTSKISFSKMVREEGRKLSWLTAVQLLVFGLLIPFRVLMVMASINSDQGAGIVYSQQRKMEILCGQIGFDQFENTFVIVAAGILCAYAAFSYLHSAQKLDFYHSLPIKREKLFAVKYVASVSTFVIAYLASQFLAVVFGVVFGCMNGTIFLEMIMASLQGILFFLCSYSGALLAIMLTGKMLTTVLATGTLGFYIPMLWLVAMMFVDVFFETAFIADIFISRRGNLRYTSPWAICLLYEGSGRQGVTGQLPGVGYMCMVIVVTVAFMLISLVLYRMRKTEVAGKAIAFVKIENLVKLLLTIPASLVAAMVAYELYASLVWELVFIILFGTLACMIMEFIYRWDIRQVLMHKSHIGITVVVSALIFFAMRFDVIGYDTYLPEKSEVTAMAVKCNMENFVYEGVEGMSEDFSYAGVSEELLDYLETEKFGPIYRLAQEGVRVAEEGTEMDEYTYIYIKYRLKNGNEIYRCYHVDRELYYDVMNEMMKVPEFKEKFYPILNWTEEYQKTLSGYAYLTNAVFPELLEKAGEEITVEIPYGKVDEVAEAYAKDFEELTFEEVWRSNSMIYFWSNVEGRYDTISYPFGPKMENTLEVIKEMME